MSGYQHRVYREDGTFWISEFRDDTARTVTTYDESGAVTSSRPYTAAENAQADETAADAVEQANEQDLQTKMLAALESNRIFLDRANPTNAQILEQVRRMTRQLNGLIRVTGRHLIDISDT